MRKKRGFLYVVLAAGLIGLGASTGTFATFNAQTTNGGNTFATGSLILSDSVQSGNVCFSYDQSNTNNANSGSDCSAVIDVSNQTIDNGTVAHGTLTVTNDGTLNASTLDLWAPSVCSDSYAPLSFSGVTLTATSSNNANLSSGFPGVATGMTVTGTGVPADTTVTSISADDTTLTLSNTPSAESGDTLTFSGPIGGSSNPLNPTSVSISNVTLTASASTLSATSSSGVLVGMTASGTGIPANDTVQAVAGGTVTLATAATAGGTETVSFSNPLCGSLVAYVEETGQAVGGTTTGTTTDCWWGPVDTGTAQAAGSTCDTTSSAIDTFAGSNPDADTLTEFTAAYPTSGPLSLTPIGAVSGTALPAGASRTFQIGLYLPATAGGDTQNALQALASTFSLTWQINQ